MSKPITFDNPRGVTFEVEPETRTIRGLALPFGDIGDNGWGKWAFAPGTLTWDKVKLLNAHEWGQVIGLATLEETDEGLVMSAKVAKTTLGDEVLALAEMGAIDGLSVGLAAAIEYDTVDDVNHVRSGRVEEVSTTPIPAFANAAIRSVAASARATQEGTTPMENQSEAQVTALAQQVTELEAKVTQLADIKVPVAPTASFEVKEEPIYRFSGTTPAPSGFDFATDLLAAAKDNDQAALKRLKEFTAANLGPKFVDTGDTAQVNPSSYKPDMFLGQAPIPASPLYDTFHKGSLNDVTPFFHSKLDRTATTIAVANHTEGVEPTATDLVTVTGATVTPAPVSGKAHITREVADQGGNPQVSGLVWAEFERSWKIALETKTAALITAAMASITALATITTGTSGLAAGAAVEAGLVDLQFIPDGYRFTRAFGHVDLYKALAGATLTTTGEKAYPIINPSNRTGITGDKFSFIDVGGYRMYPAASLGAASGTNNSLVADPSAVHVWNSGLVRLDKLQEKVEGWDIGVFGYFAGLVYDVTGLRKITYTP